ncbi:MAG: hypothetical protein Sapg2KO_18960 [Saprospiraceae bacterium]
MSGCSKDEVSCLEQLPDSLIDGVWEFESGDFDTKPEEGRIIPFLNFFSGGTFSANNSINAIAGTYETSIPAGISIDILRSTYIAESPWSSAYSLMLKDVDTYCVEENTLRLINSINNQELVFKRKEDQISCMPVQQDMKLFQNAEGDSFQWKAFRLDSTCLEIEISYSGGCGESSMQLIVSEDYGESDPPIVSAKLVFTDNDPCRALVTKSFYFDFETIREEGIDLLWINFIDLSEEVLIRY